MLCLLSDIEDDHAGTLPLLIPQRRRINRQIKQRDVIRQRVVEDGGVENDGVCVLISTP